MEVSGHNSWTRAMGVRKEGGNRLRQLGCSFQACAFISAVVCGHRSVLGIITIVSQPVQGGEGSSKEGKEVLKFGCGFWHGDGCFSF